MVHQNIQLWRLLKVTDTGNFKQNAGNGTTYLGNHPHYGDQERPTFTALWAATPMAALFLTFLVRVLLFEKKIYREREID